MQCFVCAGRGCDVCLYIGCYPVVDCPIKYIDDEIWSVIEYAMLYEKGLPPIAGGALDQAHSFVDAARFVHNEMNYWKKKLKILE